VSVLRGAAAGLSALALLGACARELDAGAIREYFQPLGEWLAEENKGQQCGW